MTRRLLEPVAAPNHAAFILTDRPLYDENAVLEFLADRYVLVSDFGERFKPLKSTPKRWDPVWPRYLYRYDPNFAQRRSKSHRSAR